MKKDTQGFVKQAAVGLTRNLATCREYNRNRQAAISMPEREKNLSRRRENDRVRETDEE